MGGIYRTEHLRPDKLREFTARHLRMKQFIGIAGGFISGPVFSGPGKRPRIDSNAARHLRMKQFIGIAGGFISGPVFFWSGESSPNQFKRCTSSADETVYRNCGRIYFRTCFFWSGKNPPAMILNKETISPQDDTPTSRPQPESPPLTSGPSSRAPCSPAKYLPR